MEPMVRPTRPGNWNCRNRLMNRQGTGWNQPEPETFGSGSKWNRNRVEPEPVGTGTEPAQPGPWPSLHIRDLYYWINPLFHTTHL